MRSRRLAAAAALLVLVFTLLPSAMQHSRWDFLAGRTGGDPLPSIARNGPAVLILLPGLTGALSPEAATEFDLGAMALLNVQTGGGPALAAAAATLSAGTRARAAGDPQLVTRTGSPDGSQSAGDSEQFRAWYGRTVPERGAALLDWARIAREAESPVGAARVGALGEALGAAGLRAAYVAGAGAEGDGAVVAADASGRIDLYLSPAGCTASSRLLPGGMRTDWAAIAAACSDLPDDVGLVVIEAGDLLLLPPWVPESVLRQVRAKVLGDLERALGALADGAGPVIAIDPLPGPGGMGVAAAPGTGADRLLISPTTRRAGVISLPDISATLTAGVGLAAPPAGGRPLASVSVVAGSARSRMHRLRGAVADARAVRTPLAQWMVGVVVISAVLIAAGMLWFPPAFSAAAHAMAALALLPPAALLAPGWRVLPAGLRPVPVWLGLVLTAVLLRRVVGLRGTVVAGAVGTCLLFIFDQLTGARWALLSPLGYCAAAGARYYGLGNEFLGVFLGAALLVHGAIVRPRATSGRRAAGGAFILLCALVVVGPAWGSNFGGGVMCSAWFAITALTGRRRSVPRRTGVRGMAAAAAGLLLLVALIAVWHAATPREAASHVGLALSGADAENLVVVARRKFLTAVRVLRYTIWTRAWFFLLAVYGLVAFRPVGWMRDAFARRPELPVICRTSVLLSLAALLSNDSGVVTAALTLLTPVAVMLLALREEVTGRERSETKGDSAKKGRR